MMETLKGGRWESERVDRCCSHDHGFCVHIVVIEALLGSTGGTKWAGSWSGGRGYWSCWAVARPPGWRSLIGWTSRTRETPSGCSWGWVTTRLEESKESTSEKTFNTPLKENSVLGVWLPHLVWWWCVPWWWCRAITQNPFSHLKGNL